MCAQNTGVNILSMRNVDKVEKDWEARGFFGGLWTDPPGTHWENYVHKVDELFMVLEGKVEIEMDGKKWCPEVGEEVFIPANVIHHVRNVGDTTSRWLYAYKSE